VRVAAVGLPALSPVVEVAAYRVTMEALTNAARHSGARTARVCFEADGDALVVTVTDDGCGLTATDRPGTGMSSMRERADELGGTLAVTSPSTGGTQVRAVPPLAVTS
jgi:signal transduction histidine kinase